MFFYLADFDSQWSVFKKDICLILDIEPQRLPAVISAAKQSLEQFSPLLRVFLLQCASSGLANKPGFTTYNRVQLWHPLLSNFQSATSTFTIMLAFPCGDSLRVNSQHFLKMFAAEMSARTSSMERGLYAFIE